MIQTVNTGAIQQPVLKKKKSFAGFSYFLMILPFLVVVFLFSYYPLYGWLYAFYNYKPPIKLNQSEFVGFYWIQSLVSNPAIRKQTLEVLRNTFAMSGLGMITSWVPMIFAVMLSEIRFSKVRRVIQTLTTLPNFISWVLVFAMAFVLFSSTGAVNTILIDLGVYSKPVLFLQQSGHVWLTMLAWGMWKSLGWNAIIYLAALMGINSELYDAASVDGAGRLRIIWHIKLPGLVPTYFVLLLLSVAHFLSNGFDQYYVFSNAFNLSRIQVLDLYVYNLGMANRNYSLATAVGMLKSVVSLTLLFVCNRFSKIMRGESII